MIRMGAIIRATTRVYPDGWTPGTRYLYTGPWTVGRRRRRAAHGCVPVLVPVPGTVPVGGRTQSIHLLRSAVDFTIGRCLSPLPFWATRSARMKADATLITPGQIGCKISSGPRHSCTRLQCLESLRKTSRITGEVERFRMHFRPIPIFLSSVSESPVAASYGGPPSHLLI